MKKLLLFMLTVSLAVAVIACGKESTATVADEPTVTIAPTATTAPTPTPSEEPTLVPTAVPNDDKDESKNNENDDGISIAPIVPSEDEDEDNNASEEEIDFPYINDVKEPSATPVIVPTTVPTVTPSEAPTSTPSPVPTVAPTKAPTVTPTVAPTATPSPVPTKVPEKVEANGDVIAWSDEVIKLSTLGIEVPVLKEFNKHALSGEAHEYISWNGDIKDDESFYELSDILDETRQAAVDKGVVHEITGQGFLMDNYAITWDYMQYSANSDLELKRSPSDGEYTLILNASLEKDMFDGRDLAPYNRDVLKVMLSVISSTPEEIYEYIYTGLYEDGSVLSGRRYMPVGDAGVMIDLDKSYIIRDTRTGHMEFKIRPQ